jgi:hypothetical protein
VLTGCAPGRCLAGTGRQFGADLDGEVQVRLVAGHLLQAFGDERGGLARHRQVPMFSNL